MSARRLDDDGYWRPARVKPEPAPIEPIEVVVLWCSHTLWDEGVYRCERRQHPPGTAHWYDIRAEAQPAIEEST